MSDAENLILTGYMGSGKTTVGMVLAMKLSRTLWDTDMMIEEAAGKSISAIFADEGEAVFRDLETSLLKRIIEAAPRNVILSVGGGLPVREENRTLLGRIGKCVLLRAKPETILKRLRDDESRPLLAGADNEREKLREIESMLEARREAYEDAADVVIDTDGRDAAEIADEIIGGMTA